jgi:hypothetical protein
LDLSGLRLDLRDALGRDVDVATPNSLHPEMKDQILSELVRLESIEFAEVSVDPDSGTEVSVHISGARSTEMP